MQHTLQIFAPRCCSTVKVLAWLLLCCRACCAPGLVALLCLLCRACCAAVLIVFQASTAAVLAILQEIACIPSTFQLLCRLALYRACTHKWGTDKLTSSVGLCVCLGSRQACIHSGLARTHEEWMGSKLMLFCSTVRGADQLACTPGLLASVS